MPRNFDRRDRGGAPRHKSSRTAQQLRLLITRQAAKLIAEGLTDYHAAKLKAARQLNCTDKGALPENHEIEAALREHLSLFNADSQPRALAELRRIALRAMRWLQIEGAGLASPSAASAPSAPSATFEPWLTGAVLNGTANEFSEIELELVGVESKTMEFMLLNRGVEFELQDAATKARSFKPTDPAKMIRYHLEFEDAPLTITLFDSHAQRQAHHPQESIYHERIKLADALILFGFGKS